MALIGREPPAQIVVSAEDVSARHAEITHVRDDQYQLADLGSTNGTYVNGERIQSVLVTPADRIDLGSCRFDLSAWRHAIPRADRAKLPAPPPPAPAPARHLSPLPYPPSVPSAAYAPPPAMIAADPASEPDGGTDRAGAEPDGSPLLFAPRALRAIARGGAFRAVAAWLVRLGALAVAVGAVALSASTWMTAPGFEPGVVAVLILFHVVLVLGLYAVMHTALIRASNIARLRDSEFVVLPVVAILLRLTGETFAWLFLTVGVGGGLLGLAGGVLDFGFVGSASLYGLAGLGLSGSIGAAAAVTAMAYGVVAAFGAVLIFYGGAELITAATMVARRR